MGLKNSKNKRNSYDIATEVSNQDFTYKKHERPLNKIEIIKNNEQDQKEITTTKITPHKTEEFEQANEVPAPRIPDWVNEINFKNMLLKTNPNIIEVLNFKAFPALAAGENYATLMLRVKITVKFQDDTSKDFSFMLKVPHDNKQMEEMLHVINFFTIENTVYQEVIPELEEMYRQAGVEVKLGANSYRLELDDKNVHYVLLEDLGVEAFKNANRLECLNMEHTLSVLRKLAQYHAATACRAAKVAAYPVVFSPDLDNDFVRTFFKQMFLSFKKPFLDNLKTYENGEKYYDLMDDFIENLADVFLRSQKLLPAYFCALNHGDSWSNNILFKYSDDGQLEETILVDFQNSKWGSPAADLYYFIFSSVQIDIKLSQFDYFVRYYYDHLNENLKLLEYPLEIPSLKEFHIQLLDFGIVATMTSFLTLGIVLLDPTDSARFENFLGDTEQSMKFKNAMYGNERYRKYINAILPWLYNRGFMEINLRELDNKIAVADKLKELESQQIEKQTENIEHSSSCYPEWVNESLFLNLIQTYDENCRKILKFTVSPATNSADYYCSTWLQIDIDIELTDHTQRHLSYILITPPSDDRFKAGVSMLDAFEKEYLTYFDIIPKLENIYKEKAGLDIIFAPKSLKIDKNDVLILENVRNKNFQNCDPLEGLDMKHIETVLQKLAQFHAGSACLFEDIDQIPEIYKQPMFTAETSKEKGNLAEHIMDAYLDCIKQYEANEAYLSKLKIYAENASTLLTKASRFDNHKFNVLNHGSCWTKNILFQPDNEENILNTYFIDYHLAKYGTPCYDLFQFLLSSPKLDLKLEHFDYFICYYHEHLVTNLELLKYNKVLPSLKDLHLDLLDNGVWAFYTMVHVLPTVLLHPKDKTNLKDSEGVKKQMFLNKCYSSHNECILPWLNNKGFLDFQ